MDKYVYIGPVQTSEMFYGRRQQVKDIIKEFREGNDRNGKSYAIIGGRRIGKTSILLEIERQINALPAEQNTSPKLVPIYLDLVDIQPQKPGDFFKAIIAQLNAQKLQGITNLHMRTDDEDNDINKVFDDFTTQIKEQVVAKMKDIRIVILADEVEFLFRHNWTREFAGKLSHLISIGELRKNVVIAMTGVTNLYQELKDLGSPLALAVDKIILNVFDEEETQKLIDEPTNGMLPTKLRDEIVQKTGRHPFLIQYIMANLDEPPTPEKLHRIIASFPEKREDFRIWQGSFDALERKILTYLIVKNAPVPHQELLRHFREDDIETMNIVDAIQKLSYTGIVKKTDKGYETNIPMFTEWYQEMSEDVQDELDKMTRRLVLDAVHDKSRTESEIIESIIPKNLSSDRIKDAVQLLEELDYIEKKGERYLITEKGKIRYPSINNL